LLVKSPGLGGMASISRRKDIALASRPQRLLLMAMWKTWGHLVTRVIKHVTMH
jgi:hypothetical protein